MAAKRASKSAKNEPKGRVSGISEAAIRGAKRGAKRPAGLSNNAAKTTRPGPGLPDRRRGRSAESIESTRAESAPARPRVSEEDASPDDFDEGLER
jgi:hypothetical protein